MCALCSLAGIASGGLNCVDVSGGSGDADTGGAGAAGVGAPPAFSLAQIVQQLRTQWGGSYEGTTESWPGTGAINYYIGGAPYSTAEEGAYKVSMTALMLSRATLAFELWDDLIARDLNQVSSAAFGQIQFEYASLTYNGSGVLSTNGGTYSRSWFNPNGTNSYGTANYGTTRDEIWLNSNWGTHNTDSVMNFGGYGFQTYMHEIGHSLGLSHPGTYNAGSGGTITYANNAEYSLDNRQYTIMSYFGGYAPGAGWQQDGTSSNWLYSSTPMLHDVAAIQMIYGADMSTRAGDTTYGFHSNAGRDAFDFNIDINPIVTVWDAGGNDTIDLSGYSTNQRVDLHAGSYSDIGGMLSNFAVAYNVTIENAIGGAGNDTLIGNEANNTMTGGAGNDVIDAGAGIDTAVFSGVRAAYTLTDLGNNNVQVSGPDGTDFVANIEFLRFSDQTVPWPLVPDLTASLGLTGAVATIVTRDVGGSATASTTNVYLSTDSTITTGDTLLTSHGVPALSGGTANTNVFALPFPGSLTPGFYFVGAIADVTGAVIESNESNNVSNAVAVLLGNNSANTLNGSSGGDTILGLGGNDRINGSAAADMLAGGLGADIFVFDGTALADASANSPAFDRITDYDQSSGAFNAAEGDQIDLSAILSAAYNHGSGQPVASLVRIVATDLGAKLQVDTDGAANGSNWTTIALIEGIHVGDDVSVILDPSGVGAWTIHVLPPLLLNNFNGDDHSDILWQNDNGTPAIWLMNAATIIGNGNLPNPGPSWHQKAAADFNGDGRSDILWQDDSGAPAIWLMNGLDIAALGPALPNSGSAWHVNEAADFNGDGKADILWQNDSGVPAIWLMDGATVTANANLPNPGPSWHQKAAADFNGDGKADILWQNDNGTPAIWLMDGVNVLRAGPNLPNPGPSWHAKAAGDFNGDSKADILWQNDNGTPAIWLMDGVNVLLPTPNLPNPGSGWHVKEAGDFNGDGHADILWQYDTGRPAIWLMDGAGVLSFGAALPDPGPSWHVI